MLFNNKKVPNMFCSSQVAVSRCFVNFCRLLGFLLRCFGHTIPLVEDVAPWSSCSEKESQNSPAFLLQLTLLETETVAVPVVLQQKRML